MRDFWLLSELYSDVNTILRYLHTSKITVDLLAVIALILGLLVAMLSRVVKRIDAVEEDLKTVGTF